MPEGGKFIDLFKGIAGSHDSDNEMRHCLKDEAIRQAFFAFATAHPKSITSSPLLTKASVIANSPNAKPIPVFGYIKAVFSKAKHLEDFEKKLLQSPEERETLVDRNRAPTWDLLRKEYCLLSSYIEEEIIEPTSIGPDIIALLKNGGGTYFVSKELTADVFPLLTKLATTEKGQDLLFAILKIQTAYGSTIFTYPGSLKDLLPLFEILILSEEGCNLLLKFLSIQDRDGRTFFTNVSNFRDMMPLFIKMATSEQGQDHLIKILSIQDSDGKTCFDDRVYDNPCISRHECLNIMMDLFKSLLDRKDLLVKILSIKKSDNPHVLSPWDIFKALLFLFPKLTSSNGGRAVINRIRDEAFHYVGMDQLEIFKNLLDVSGMLVDFKQPQEFFIEIFNFGYLRDTLLSFPKTFSIFLPVLLYLAESDKGKNYVKELLSQKDSEGKTLLHHNDILTEAEPLIAVCEIDLKMIG
jgi:hypothetical protein